MTVDLYSGEGSMTFQDIKVVENNNASDKCINRKELQRTRSEQFFSSFNNTTNICNCN